jgi:hypothetical protein
MATVNLHTGIMTSPKHTPLSDSAMRLWLNGLLWSKEHLTDGFIPDANLSDLHRQASRHVGELLRVAMPGKQPLWHKVEGGYQIHDYADWQDSAESVQTRRRKWRDAKRGVSKPSKQDSAQGSVMESAMDSTSESSMDSREGVGGGCGGGTERTEDQTDDDRDVGGSGAHLRLVESSSVTDHGSGRHGLAVREFVEAWNRIRTEPKIATLTPSERRAIVAALQVHSLDHLEVCLRLSEESDYLAGRKDRTGISVEMFFYKLDAIARGEYRNRPRGQTRVAGLSGGGIPASTRPPWRCHHADQPCGINAHCFLRTLREIRAGTARLEDVPEPLHTDVRDALAEDTGRTA